MKYTLETECAPCSFEEFTQKHNLELVVHERVLDRWSKQRGLERYYANFRNVDVKDGSVLIGEYGNGNTPEEAILAYAETILGKLLVLNAGSDKRYEFVAPNEWKCLEVVDAR